ncbi:MAG TPA: hypothetical protein DCL45_12220 [Chloroflexi bacterium]|nr:hypothetical protein [Chloroflexota bacterium]
MPPPLLLASSPAPTGAGPLLASDMPLTPRLHATGGSPFRTGNPCLGITLAPSRDVMPAAGDYWQMAHTSTLHATLATRYAGIR